MTIKPDYSLDRLYFNGELIWQGDYVQRANLYRRFPDIVRTYWPEVAASEESLKALCRGNLFDSEANRSLVWKFADSLIRDYQHHPAFQEGLAAHAEGIRRGQNPYSASGDQRAAIGWWAGWDAEDLP